MKTQFYILLSQKSSTGFTAYGEFWLGSDRQEATSVFGLLKGNKDSLNKALLHFDLMETVDGIPLKVLAVSCTLEEYAANCKVIAKETFKRMNLEQGLPGLI